MLYRLRRNPLPILAEFEWSVCLTYAMEAAALRPLVPAGLELETWAGHGLLAVVLGRTRRLRPACLGWMPGQSFTLAAYRVFVRYRDERGRELRGLRVLRTDVSTRLMAGLGRVTTRYNYRHAPIGCRREGEALEVAVAAGERLRVRVDLTPGAGLPEGSVFASVEEARRFVAPLTWTFDHEPETGSIVRTRGVRRDWRPRPVAVREADVGFLRRFGPAARLSGAFFVEWVDYAWRRGLVSPVR